jgi:hypothetical protein
MLTSVIKEGIAEGSTKDKGTSAISEVMEGSAVVPMLVLVAKEGITGESTNEGTALISGLAGWSIVFTSNHNKLVRQYAVLITHKANVPAKMHLSPK